MTSFEINVANGGDHVVRLAVEGEVNASTAPHLLGSMLYAAAAHDRRNIVLDLRDVSSIDGAGLDAIVRVNRYIRDLDSHLIICNPSRTIECTFDGARLDGSLDVRSSDASPMSDLVALRAVAEHSRRVMTTSELATALQLTDDEAAARITALTKDGYLSGPVQYRSESGEWSEIGVKVTEDGRDRLGAE